MIAGRLIPRVWSSVVHIQQHDDVSCAQHCAAMLLGKPLAEVMSALPPSRKGTRHKRLINYLRANGVSVGDRFVSARVRPWPLAAIVRITWEDRSGHVVLKLGDTWHDSAFERGFHGTPRDREYVYRYLDGGRRTGRITSLLSIGQQPLDLLIGAFE